MPSPEMDRLISEVAETTSAVDSAVTFIQGIVAQLRDAQDLAQVKKLADDLDAAQTRLANAITVQSSQTETPES